MNPAVFLDRDGTIIKHVHHLRHPEHVELIPGVGPALGALQQAGYKLVVVTNQSVVGRGLLTFEGLEEVHRAVSAQLRSFGVRIDSFYSCPIVPKGSDRLVVEHPDRKPGPGMILRAMHELGIDAAGSWMIGDALSDALAGRNAGCQGSILVRTGFGREHSRSGDLPHFVDHVAEDLAEAAQWILARRTHPAGPGRPGSSDVEVLMFAAGVGRRLRPLTEHTPKCLVEIGGKPLLDYWLDALEAAGLESFRINSHHAADRLRAYISRVHLSERPFRIEEVHEPELLGSAGTVTANRDLAKGGRPVLLVYSDNLSDLDLRQMLDFHRAHPDPVTMMVYRAEQPERCGIVELDDEHRITSFVEKPNEPRTNLANGGLYVMDAAIFREVADMEAHDLAFDVLPRLVGRMRAFVWNGYHLDVGTLGAHARAERDVTLGRVGRRRE
jgi:mannose-1-phosphate guanylyltransferase